MLLLPLLVYSAFNCTRLFLPTERLAFCINILEDKKARFVSNKSFLRQSHDEKFMLNCLCIILEPSNGNFDNEFNTKYTKD